MSDLELLEKAAAEPGADDTALLALADAYREHDMPLQSFFARMTFDMRRASRQMVEAMEPVLEQSVSAIRTVFAALQKMQESQPNDQGATA